MRVTIYFLIVSEYLRALCTERDTTQAEHKEPAQSAGSLTLFMSVATAFLS